MYTSHITNETYFSWWCHPVPTYMCVVIEFWMLFIFSGGDVGKSKYCCPCECICNCCQCNQNNDSTCTPHDPDVLNTDTDSSCSEYDFDHDDLKNTYSDDPDDYGK